MLLSTVFAEVLYMEKKTLSDKKSDNDVALGKDNCFHKIDTVRYQGFKDRIVNRIVFLILFVYLVW